MHEDERSLAKSRSQQKTLERLNNALISTGLTGGSVLMTGVVLESFLKVPITNLSIYVPAGIASGIVGAAVSRYLNKQEHNQPVEGK